MFFHPSYCTFAQKFSTFHTKDCTPEFPTCPVYKLPSYRLVDFIDMSTYILAESRTFKTLKENYAIGLKMCYLFSKNVVGTEHDIDGAYGVCRH